MLINMLILKQNVFVGAPKNRLTETVLWSSQNICLREGVRNLTHVYNLKVCKSGTTFQGAVHLKDLVALYGRISLLYLHSSILTSYLK